MKSKIVSLVISLFLCGSCWLGLAAWATAQTVDVAELARLEEAALQSAVERVAPAVVQLQLIGGVARSEGINLGEGPVTGLIIAPDGWVVMSRYRCDPLPSSILARLADGRQFAARIVASDRSRQLVLLHLEGGEGLPTAEVAPSQSVRVGQWAIAVGRTYRLERPNVAVGILSAQRRLFGRALQTDAAVSAANYGGPLVDIHGRVLGVLTPMSPTSDDVVAGVNWYDSGIGFAVPLESWLATSLERLAAGKDLERGYLGVALEKGSPRETPAKISSVLPGGPAAVGGLDEGDQIIAVETMSIRHQNDLQFALTPRYAGDAVEITYQRAGEERQAKVTLITAAQVAELQAAAKEEESAEGG